MSRSPEFSVDPLVLRQPEHDIPSVLFDDPYFQRCIELSRLTDAPETHGALIEYGGTIIGEGRNRAIAHKDFKLDRVIRMGFSNHAEVEAMNDALMHGYSLKGTTIYVAGIMVNENNLLYIADHFSCVKCIPYMRKFGVSGVHVPTRSGWKYFDTDQAFETAQFFKKFTYEKRLAEIKKHGVWTYEDYTAYLNR